MGHSIKGTVKCNMGCKYCYESTARQQNASAGEQKGYDVSKIIEFIENPKNNVQKAPNLHGGEPLLLPKDQNERLLKYIYEKFGSTGIQTNSLNIDEDYIRMFKAYKTDVGVSVDGPGELNMGRWMGSEARTLEAADRIMDKIRWMKQEGIKVSIIAVVSRQNAAPDKLERLKAWLLELKELGVKSGRLNMVQVDYPELADEFELTQAEAIHFYETMAPFLREHDLKYAPFTDVVNGLLGYGHDTCVTTGCDPFHTVGEQPIYGDGTQGNCLRTAKDGVVYLAETTPSGNPRISNERYVILRQIPMEEGGCGGCRFWHICQAHCPADGEDGDWRNKSRHCQSYKALYEATEKALKQMMPKLKLTSELELPDGVIQEEMKSRTLYTRVFEDMNKKKGAF